MQAVYKNIVSDIIPQFKAVSLKEIDKISFLNRVDTKFVFNIHKLPDILKESLEYYKILEIKKNRIFSYKTYYFDSDDYKLYLSHQNGKLNRYKVRIREYLTTKDYFVELKQKTNKNRTVKTRLKIDKQVDYLPDNAMDFLNKQLPIDVAALKNKLTVLFDRITLADFINNERVTVDFNLKYEKNNNTIELPYLTIVEIKNDRNSSFSELYRILKKHNIHPLGMSKYCIGLLQFEKELKYNNFKKRLITLKKIKNETSVA
ncbi:MAG: polyphosphate polymerase domain-containing protein [Marinilabiliales bacterium]